MAAASLPRWSLDHGGLCCRKARAGLSRRARGCGERGRTNGCQVSVPSEAARRLRLSLCSSRLGGGQLAGKVGTSAGSGAGAGREGGVPASRATAPDLLAQAQLLGDAACKGLAPHLLRQCLQDRASQVHHTLLVLSAGVAQLHFRADMSTLLPKLVWLLLLQTVTEQCWAGRLGRCLACMLSVIAVLAACTGVPLAARQSALQQAGCACSGGWQRTQTCSRPQHEQARTLNPKGQHGASPNKPGAVQWV